MNFIAVLCLLIVGGSRAFTDDSNNAQNKSKRTVSHLVQSYGESRPLILYSDPSSGSSPSGIYRPAPSVFEPSETSKHVAAQQVLYEFQETPTNAVSNVHVNQFYQPLMTHHPHNKNEERHSSNNEHHRGGNNQFAETVASPVQHSTLVRHGQNFGQFQFQPLGSATPHHIQTQQYVPGKYLYVNGKITIPQAQPSVQPQLAYPQYPQQTFYQNQVKPQTFYNPLQHHHQFQVPKQRLQAPLAHQAPVSSKQFHPPQRHQIQQITKPMGAPEKESHQTEEEEADDDETPAPVEEAEEDEDVENDDSEDYEGDHSFGHYAFDGDDDHDREQGDDGDDAAEEEDDSDRGSTKHVPSKSYHDRYNRKKKTSYKKNNRPQNYKKGNNYGYSESYSSNSKYDSKQPKKNKSQSSKKTNGKKKVTPRTQYKTMKYSRQIGKPRYEQIESNPSENVPVVHKQKIFKEKWFVSKSSEQDAT